MGNPLRDRRPVAELAARGQVIEISEKIGSFNGLARIVEDDLSTLDADTIPHDWREAPVTGRLEFGFLDAQRQVPAIEGAVRATVDAVCQRCLRPFRPELDVELRLLPGVDGQSAAVTEGFEVWEIEDESIRPIDIVEEALIMALPLSAMHDASADECGEPVTEAGDDGPTTTRPFASLRAQLDENR